MLRFITYFGNSCAVAGIDQLGTHLNAVSAMKDFCKQQLGVPDSFITKYSKLTTFYVFSAGPEVPGFGHSKPWVKYGTEFAQFIIDNNLGTIATLPAAYNLKEHPTTTAQVWLWWPDQKRLEDWWNKNRNT